MFGVINEIFKTLIKWIIILSPVWLHLLDVSWIVYILWIFPYFLYMLVVLGKWIEEPSKLTPIQQTRVDLGYNKDDCDKYDWE